MKTISMPMLALFAVLVGMAFVVGGQPADESAKQSSGTAEKKQGYADRKSTRLNSSH